MTIAEAVNRRRSRNVQRRFPGSALILLFLLSSVTLFAQNTRYRFAHLSIKNGLSDNSAFCMLQDSYGFMWLGTFSGLDRFDGNSATVFKPDPEDPNSITGSVVFALLEDSRRNLWVGLDGGGLDRFDRRTQSFTAFHHNAADPGSLAGDQVFSLAEDALGSIWVGTGGSGLDRLDEGKTTFAHYRAGASPGSLKSDTIRCILLDKSQRLWIGTAGGGLSRYDRTTDGFVTYRHRADDNTTVGSDTIRALYQDTRGRLWVGTEGGGLSLYLPDSDSFVTFRHRRNDPTSFSGQTARSIVEDSTGQIWIGTETSGVNLYNPTTGTFSHINSDDTRQDALSGDKIRSVCIDDGGLVWIGTRDAGINLYNPRSRAISHIRTRHPVRQITEDAEGRLLYGTDGGGLIIHSPATGQDTVYAHSDSDPWSISSDIVYSVVPGDPGHLWVGTDGGGLDDLDLATGRAVRYLHDPNKESSIGSNTVWALFRDNDGTLWVGTEGGGLNRFDPTTSAFTHYRFSSRDPHSLSGNSVRTIFKDSRGRLWIGTWDGGLSRYRSEADDFVSFKRDAQNPASLGDNSVTCIFEDHDGRLWIGTAGSGLNRYNESTGSFEHLTHTEGLAADNIFGITQDQAGFLWVSTANGLSRIDPNTMAVSNFGVADGLTTDEFAQNAFYCAPDGTMYFGGPRGIDFFDPMNVRRNPNVPKVVITGVRILGKTLATGRDFAGMAFFGRSDHPGTTLYLDSGDRMASFDFAVLDYAAPSMNQYAMKIEGLQTDWTYLGHDHTAVISSLRPGNYLLRVKGANNNGLWNETGTSLRIHVSPPWWQSLWFEIAAGILLVALAASVYVFRMLQLKRRAYQLQAFSNHIQTAREEERKNAAREVHDQLGQHLAALKMQLCWLESHADADASAIEQTAHDLVELVDAGLESAKTISSKLRPKVLDNLSLAEAIRWQVDDFRRKTGLRCIANISDVTTEPPESVRTGLFRVFQEVLTNVTRHSSAHSLKVTFDGSEFEVVLDVRDDGRGITDEQIHARDSFGILGMRERCALFGGQFSIGGRPGEGTRVIVRAPVNGRPLGSRPGMWTNA